ncbi:MAG: class I SAM-dependent methyltransferase [Planctomycetes bacterium]|nr:class I SAM-dependent methyltransferase [Planctomycetota bacterium]
MNTDDRSAALERRIAELEAELGRQRTWRPPGHFYSPIPDPAEVEKRQERIFDCTPRHLPGIDLNAERQLGLLDEFKEYYREMSFPVERQDGRRYWFENIQYSYSDAVFLYCMIRHARPRSIIEVGSGHSSCLMLDTSDLFFGGAIECTFIDPFPEALRALLLPGDEARVRIVPEPVQDVPLELFSALEENDILFIDSTHVVKTGGDVNHLFFEVLPRLARGVYVHVHDVHFPFEYPKEWVLEGRAWNETYLLRAFLMYNRAFEVQCMNTALERFRTEWFREHMPLCLKNPGGSIWLRKAGE